jgi:hypothetical protein
MIPAPDMPQAPAAIIVAQYETVLLILIRKKSGRIQRTVNVGKRSIIKKR